VNVYEIVTDKMVAALEAGAVPWQVPWQGGAGWAPRNLVSGKRYTGVNPFLLSLSGFGSPYWLTFKQAKMLDGSVRKGEKSSIVVFFKMMDGVDKASGEARKIPILRFYRVFNLDQCDGVRVPAGRDLPETIVNDVHPLAAGEAIVSGYRNAPTVVEGEPQAFYRPGTDVINMPPRVSFNSSEEWYSTLFHEMGHSTAHASRLNRTESIGNGFGSHAYGREELIAEMTSAYLCAEAGIVAPFDNSAAYIASWLKTIKSDTRAVVVAAGKASKAADHILGRVAAPVVESPTRELVAV